MSWLFGKKKGEKEEEKNVQKSDNFILNVPQSPISLQRRDSSKNTTPLQPPEIQGQTKKSPRGSVTMTTARGSVATSTPKELLKQGESSDRRYQDQKILENILKNQNLLDSEEAKQFRQQIQENTPLVDLEESQKKGKLIPVFILKTKIDETRYNLMNKVRVKIFFKFDNDQKAWATQLIISLLTPCSEFYQTIVDSVKKRHSTLKISSNDILIKARGEEEYIYGKETPLIDFEYIRHSFQENKLIELSLEMIHSEFRTSFSLYEKNYPFGAFQYNGDDLIGFNEYDVISSWELNKKPLRIFIKNINENGNLLAENYYYSIAVRMFYGKTLLSQPQITENFTESKIMKWNEYLIFSDMMISEIPKEVNLLFTLMARSKESLEKTTYEKTSNEEGGICIGWSRLFLYDQMNELKTGSITLKLWQGDPDFNILNSTQNSSSNALALNFEFDTFVLPVIFPQGKKKQAKRVPISQLDFIIKQDCLKELTEKEKLLVWNYRDHLQEIPISLPKVIQSVDWSEYTHVQEIHRLLKSWKQFEDPRLALELLDCEVQDRVTREYAISILDKISDFDLSNIMLQLVEIVKFEHHHFSPFVCFLLRRAIKSPHLVGHRMFWCLKSQLENERFKERFSLILEEYLRSCDKDHRIEIEIQIQVVNEFLKIASTIATQPKNTKNEDLTNILFKLLKDLKLPPKFSTPLNIKVQCCGINIEKCKVMSSKKRPLMLNLKNADECGDDVVIFFKAGDDLRQDELTLQMLRVMDSLWKMNGLDLHINAYECVSTSKNCGIIQCVPNSKTIAKLSDKLNDTIANETILNWINKECRTQESIDLAIEHFKLSCAGYLVATHVLGIGDRHNDNIMITNKGDVFHIDFGHFLGNKKSVDLGITSVERETGPFVFTKAYAHVLGGIESLKYKELQDLTGRAFNILRENGNLLMVLFKLMIHCGLPELQRSKDIEWVRDKLVLEMSNEEASKHFCGLFIESMSNKRQLVMDAVHYWKHHLK